MASVSAANLREMIGKNVDPASRLMTDEARICKKIGSEFKGGHQSVFHGIGEYARGDAHINNRRRTRNAREKRSK